jgi:hypothetical protein
MNASLDDGLWNYQAEKLLEQWVSGVSAGDGQSFSPVRLREALEFEVRLLEKTALLAQEAGDLSLSLWSQSRSAQLLGKRLEGQESEESEILSLLRETQDTVISRLSHIVWKKISSLPSKNLLAESEKLV